MKDFKNFTVLSCEHAGNKIPSFLKDKVFISEKVLTSHKGLDVGALYLAKIMQKDLGLKLYSFEVCRLVIEGNRPIDDSALFSRYMREVSNKDKKKLIEKIYHPHWTRVESEVEKKLKSEKKCLHIGVHTFTPVFKGVKRNLDIGLLFDPKNKLEKSFCVMLQKKLTLHGFVVRMNYPYKGIEPGMTQSFRTKFKNYGGIELEVSQKIFRQKSFVKKSKLISQIFKECLRQMQ